MYFCLQLISSVCSCAASRAIFFNCKNRCSVCPVYWKTLSQRIWLKIRNLSEIISICIKSFQLLPNERRFVSYSLNRQIFEFFGKQIFFMALFCRQIFAIDNISKEFLWSYLIDDEFEPFSVPTSEGEARIPLFIQRSYRHYPHPMWCTILVRERVSKNFYIICKLFCNLCSLITFSLRPSQATRNGVIISFNPIKGKFGYQQFIFIQMAYLF